MLLCRRGTTEYRSWETLGDTGQMLERNTSCMYDIKVRGGGDTEKSLGWLMEEETNKPPAKGWTDNRRVELICCPS